MALRAGQGCADTAADTFGHADAERNAHTLSDSHSHADTDHAATHTKYDAHSLGDTHSFAQYNSDTVFDGNSGIYCFAHAPLYYFTDTPYHPHSYHH